MKCKGCRKGAMWTDECADCEKDICENCCYGSDTDRCWDCGEEAAEEEG